jgi:hypothetical protein
MKTHNPAQSHRAKSLKWFRRQRYSHNPMLVFSMSIFNSGRSWERIFSPVPQRENVWA